VDDVAGALVVAATTGNISGEVINIGSGRETSINELIKRVELVVGRKVDALHNTAEGGGVRRLYADIGKARHLLGFKPRISLDEGLRLTLLHDLKYQPSR